jgi:hypothetical protein
MMADLRSIQWLFSLLLLLAFAGCRPGDDSAKNQQPGRPEAKLFFFAGFPLHAEITADVQNGTLTLTTLGADAETIQPVKAEAINLVMQHGNHVDKFTFAALPQAGDPAGTSSRFSVKSVHLTKAVFGKAGRSAELLLTLDGKPLLGRVEESHHDHLAHGDHAHDHHEHAHHDHDEHAHVASNVLLWHEDVGFEGNTIRLGQHGLVVQSGTELEPAVSIDRNGQPVSDAKVYASLLDGNGEKILAQQQQAIFEPATEEEPAHYAQDFLFVPEDAKKVTIRYRIELVNGSTTTRDILIQTESHAH